MSMQWYPTTHDDYDMLKGYEVRTSDNEKLGKIDAIYHPKEDMPEARGHHVFKVDPGTLKELFTSAEDVYIPERLIRSVDTQDDRVILEVPKDMVKNEDWSKPKNLDTYRST